MRHSSFTLGLLNVVLCALVADASPVLMISVDGLSADDIEMSRQGGTKIPAIQSLMNEGAFASRVKGVLPSITYPSHTTLITGVSPDVHGITSNVAFDPYGKNKEGWNWYSSDIRVPTLWDRVHSSGKKVASVNWPVSVGSPSIDYNVPEFWLARSAEDVKILRALSPDLLPVLEKEIDHELGITLTTPFSDEDLARIAAHIISTRQPDFTTLHIAELDHVKHIHGPKSKEAAEQLKKTDAIIGDLVARARKGRPDITIAIVSDHGFAPARYEVNLFVPFVKNGLITIDKKTNNVTAWKAMPWSNGGSAAIILKNPKDKTTLAQVEKLLMRLKSNPQNGIRSVQATDSTAAGEAHASFWVDFQFGFLAGRKRSSPIVSESTTKGMHGYFPFHPEMDSVFIIAGPRLSRKGSINSIDMRDIAPTIAKLLGVAIPGLGTPAL